MTIPARINCLQSYQTILYNKALHPDLFQIQRRRVITCPAYEAELWLMPGSHGIRFEHGSICATELVTDQESGLPSEGVLGTFLCAGERDFEHRFARSGAGYMTSVQTETLSENLFISTYDEMMAHAKQQDALSLSWHDGGPCLSVLDSQRYAKEVHIQSYHLIAYGGVVLRTQSIFEHR